VGLAIRLLGPLEADVAEGAADLGGPRQRAVLALLLVARGEVVSVDRLIEDLWRGEPPPRATGSLQVFVANLRRALEPGRAPRTPSRYLISAAPGYALRVDEAEVDAWHFERTVRTAGDELTADPARAVATLEAALGLWRGAALAEFATESWAAPEAARLDELRLVARERLVDARIQAGRVGEAAVEAEALVRDLPLREEGWRLLALSQYLAGRQGDALATLRRARHLLAEELGVDPGHRLAELEQAVLAQAVELPRRRAAVDVAPSAAEDVPRAPSGFVGRVVELQQLRAAAEATVAGVPAVAVVGGEAGGGKSALLARLRDELRAAGWLVTVGRCPEGEGSLPAWAWAEALRSLAAEHDPGEFTGPLAPLLSDEAAETGDSGLLGRFRLHRAVRDWLAGVTERPLAVLLDDAHRADAETRALLASLLDEGLPIRLLFVLAYRPEPGDALDELRALLARHQPMRVRLGGLAGDDVAALIEDVTGTAPDPELVATLAERTDGNPFYVKESARLLASEGVLVATSHVPEGVADVLRRRLARLPEESVSVLRLASVIGRDVDVAVLVRAAEVDEDVVLDALEAGVISALLIEPGPGAVRFSHLLVRETLYAGVPNLRRVRWHARVADAITELYPHDLTAIAHHRARAATAATARAAASACVAAAELAVSRFAWDAEAELYAEAERCLGLAAEPDLAALVDAKTRRVRALMRTGDTTTAVTVRREAVALAEQTDDLGLLARAVCCATHPEVRGNLRSYGETDHDLVATIERVLRHGLDPVTRCQVLTTLVRETSGVDDPRSAPAYAEASALAHQIGDPDLIGMALWAANEVYLADFHPVEREAIRTEVSALAAEHQHPGFQAYAHVMAVNRNCVELDLASARDHVEQLRELSRAYQLRQGQFFATFLEAMLAHFTGDLTGAESLYDAAFETQVRHGTVDADAGLVLARITVRHTQGRLPELVEPMRAMFDSGIPAIGHLLALALAQRGDLPQAREVLRASPPPYHDYLWVLLNSARALTVAIVGASDLAPALYEGLRPHAGQVAGAGSNGFVFTPVARALGQLALLLGRPDDARAHFEQAREVARRCGSQPWLAQVEADFALLPVAD
jgi:DNA-binding SARP family transcriptional activator